MIERHGGQDRRDRKHRGQQRAQSSIESPGVNVARLHSLIDYGALLKEKHPGSDRGANGGENQHENFVTATGWQGHPGGKRMAHGVPIGARENRSGNEKSVEDG